MSKNHFHIKYFCAWWGLDHLGTEGMLKKIKEGGFDGVEIGIPDDKKDRDTLRKLLDENELDVIAHQYFANSGDIKEYKKQFAYYIEAAASFKPISINSHTGKDHWPLQDNLALVDIGNEIGDKYGVKVLHESHRGRFLYSAPVSLSYFKSHLDIKICADLSHWVCVSESLLEDQQEAVQSAILRAHHIHGRVGHAQGPQINDPRAPEWEIEVKTFTGWWQQIIDRAKADHLPFFTITPEFGPLPYMWSKPFTQEPLGDQWEINCYMKDYLKKTLKY